MVSQSSADSSTTIRVLQGTALTNRMPALTKFAMSGERSALSRHPAWLSVLRDALRHQPYVVEAIAETNQTVGWLPLCYMRSLLFGSHLVSLPYLNSNGVQADGSEIATRLVGRAVELANELEVQRLELRQEEPVEHPALNGTLTSKVHMRLALPDFPGPLWEGLKDKVRNQVRKGEKSGLTVEWGGLELLPEFYAIFSRKMRDLGTPVYGQSLFRAILAEFPAEVELCLVRAGDTPAATALLLHGNGITEVPSASALSEYNKVCANMLMYWHLISRAIEREQSIFDFGRTTVDSGPYKFKKQWGAQPIPAIWQYHLRQGTVEDLRPDNPRFQRMIQIWQRLPVPVTRWIGPSIVRGIP